MSRDPGKLKVFQIADGLVVDAYRLTRRFPSEERLRPSFGPREAAIPSTSLRADSRRGAKAQRAGPAALVPVRREPAGADCRLLQYARE
jgi:hypothetical protein